MRKQWRKVPWLKRDESNTSRVYSMFEYTLFEYTLYIWLITRNFDKQYLIFFLPKKGIVEGTEITQTKGLSLLMAGLTQFQNLNGDTC